ncbi:MAG: shikimate kinase [Eubacteriales bacterium]|nr:shikimate kinase [Eubacteriales bacterium]
MTDKKSIILIGMPGAGKSTIGPLLAEKLGLSFADTDDIIKESDGRELRDIVAQDGFEGFLRLQQKILMSRELKGCVISTGGSVIKSEALMSYFSSIGRIVYLKTDVEILEQRLAPGRRLARANGQTIRQMFEEREPLYIKYAECIIDCTGKNPEEIASEICL